MSRMESTQLVRPKGEIKPWRADLKNNCVLISRCFILHPTDTGRDKMSDRDSFLVGVGLRSNMRFLLNVCAREKSMDVRHTMVHHDRVHHGTCSVQNGALVHVHILGKSSHASLDPHKMCRRSSAHMQNLDSLMQKHPAVSLPAALQLYAAHVHRSFPCYAIENCCVHMHRQAICLKAALAAATLYHTFVSQYMTCKHASTAAKPTTNAMTP